MEPIWNPTSISAVALAGGTALLAAAALVTARRTRHLAEHAKAQAEAAERQLALLREQLSILREQVSLASEQIDLARTSIETTIKPLLVDVPRGGAPGATSVTFADGRELSVREDAVLVTDEGDDFAYCSLPLRNVGSGTAFIRGLGLRFGKAGWSGKASTTIVPPGEHTRLAFTIPRDRGELTGGLNALRRGTFEVEVRYTDAAGAQDSISRLSVKRAEGDWRVRQVFLRRPDEEPYASSGPADL